MKNFSIFISYARPDANFALKLTNDLKKTGNIVWLDQLDIRIGADWAVEIENGLLKCKILLVILSPYSISSNQVLKEIDFARRENKRIIFILLTKCDIPIRIQPLKFIDFTTEYETALEKLKVEAND